MAVKIAPKAPQAAPISGSADQMALPRMMAGEKQYRASATYPPALPNRRRATYQIEAPSNRPNASWGSATNARSSRTVGRFSEDHSFEVASSGADAIRY